MEKLEYQGSMSSGDLFVCRRFSRQLDLPLFFFLPQGKGYFQRMKEGFPLDLRIIKERNNESSPPPGF